MVLLLFVLALILRSIFITQFPIGVTHDELNYILAAKSLANNSGFVPGTAPAVIQTGMQNFDVVIAEVPAYILSIFARFNIDLRLVGAVFSSLTIVVIHFLVVRLFKNKHVGLIAAAVAAINPWSFQIGRTVFETNFIVLFFLLGLLFLLSNQGKRIFFSLPFFLLGFFSYTGGQISFYLFIVVSLIYKYLNTKRKDKRLYLGYFVAITAVLALYLASVLTNQSFASRGGEIFMPSNIEVARQVDAQRLLAVPSPFNSLFINKGTVYLTGLVEKYLKAFDVNTLFVKGELRAAFSLEKHGTFYFIDFLFLLIGVCYLYSKNKKLWLFVLALIGVSAVTPILSIIEYSYTQRAALMYPFLIILIAFGIYSLVTILKGMKLRIPASLGLILVYIILCLNMLHLYFFRVPVYASDGWFFQDRVLATYINNTLKSYPEATITVVTFEPKLIFEEYLHYSNLYKGGDIAQINARLDQKTYRYNNVSFTTLCPEEIDSNLLVIDPLVRCTPRDADKPLRITRFKDVYENYLIYNDSVCQKFELSSYVSPQAFQDFNVENQDTQKFCQSWITKL